MLEEKNTTKEPSPISVSHYLDQLNRTLIKERAKIIGEVLEVKLYPERSYLYFTLKDKQDQSSINCFMWKRDFMISGIELKDGLEVIVTAYPNIYKPKGTLTLNIELIELVGEGALQIAYEKLKKKLELEGLFSPLRKRKIPDYPHRIGVITSRSGAVINDFLSNIGKFGYEILFVDSKVEGQEAIRDLMSAVKTMENKYLDVLILMRGGGSLESFQSFNNETLVRQIADFPAPVITGIGHDKDIPLVSLVSDRNVSTPTAVANLLNSSWSEAKSNINLICERIFSSFQSNIIDVFRKAENTMFREAEIIGSEIKRIGELLNQANRELFRGFETLSKNAEQFINQNAKTIELDSPMRQLKKGYSIVRSHGKIIRKIKDVKSGDELNVFVSDGAIKSRVT